MAKLPPGGVSSCNKNFSTNPDPLVDGILGVLGFRSQSAAATKLRHNDHSGEEDQPILQNLQFLLRDEINKDFPW